MSEQYEVENTELDEELRERVFILDKNGNVVPLVIHDDTEGEDNAE